MSEGEHAQHHTYSLWLCPQEYSVEHNRLAEEIQHFASQFNATPFPPHVTLAGHISATPEHAITISRTICSQVKVGTAEYAADNHQFHAVVPGTL